MDYNINAYAKVNLSLRVTGRDCHGFHMLDTVMTTVSLSDTVNVDFRKDTEVKTVFAPAGGVDPLRNTALSAAQLFARELGGANIFITKHIPVMAGLGGSSVDAAAVVRAYTERNNLELDGRLIQLIRGVGSDVPFLINGGAARCFSRGEELSPLAALPPLNLVIAMSGQVSTAQCFTQYRNTNPHIKADNNNTTEELILAWQQGDLPRLGSLMHNDLEPSSAALNPSIRNARKAMEQLSSMLGITMTGSGGAYVGLFPDTGSAAQAAQALQPHVSFVRQVITLSRA